jgi:hypothetical protein
MKTLLSGDSLKDLLELNLIKIRLMLLKVAGMIPKTIGIPIFSIPLVICKDLIKCQRIKKLSQLLANIISLKLLVKMLLNTPWELSFRISKAMSSQSPVNIIPTAI